MEAELKVCVRLRTVRQICRSSSDRRWRCILLVRYIFITITMINKRYLVAFTNI